MKRFYFLFVLLLLAGCGRVERGVPDEIPVESADGTPAALPPAPGGVTVVADGELASPYPSVALGFGGTASGQVLTITVQAGEWVAAGDLLAVLDDSELQNAVADADLALQRAVTDRDLAQAQWESDVADAEEALAGAQRALTRAQLDVSNTSVEEARTALERAQADEEYAHRLYDEAYGYGWMPAELLSGYYDSWQHSIRERELAELRLADAQDSNSASYLQIQAAEEDVAQAERALVTLQRGVAPSYERAVEDAEGTLADAEETLARARLTAPWAAIVLSVDVAPAALVSGSTPVVTLLNVADGLRFVTQNLSEQHIADIRPGQRAVVTLRTFADSPLEGTVVAVVPQTGQAAAADARFAVHVRLAPTGLELLPGLSGRVEVFVGE